LRSPSLSAVSGSDHGTLVEQSNSGSLINPLHKVTRVCQS
jgi:hypothetical protein